MLVMLDGTVGDPTAPALRADDLGVLRGDGVFETVLVVDGHPHKLDAHLDRMARSAAALDLPVPDRDAWLRCARQVCAGWPSPGEMVLRLVLTRGVEGGGPVTGYALGSAVPELTLRQRSAGVSVLTLDRGWPDGFPATAPWMLTSAKILSYAVPMAAQRFVRAAGADDAVFVSADGWVMEAATATVVLVDGHTLRTPPPSAGILPGTTQQALFAAAAEAGWTTLVEPVPVADLHSAEAVWLVSSVRRLAAVHTVDRTPRPVPSDGAPLRALLDRLHDPR